MSDVSSFKNKDKCVTVKYYDNGVQKYDRLVVGMPGMETNGLNFVKTLQVAVNSSNCGGVTKIISPDLLGTSYNLLEAPLIGSLKLADIIGGLFSC
jgi:hypothetical protein